MGPDGGRSAWRLNTLTPQQASPLSSPAACPRGPEGRALENLRVAAGDFPRIISHPEQPDSRARMDPDTVCPRACLLRWVRICDPAAPQGRGDVNLKLRAGPPRVRPRLGPLQMAGGRRELNPPDPALPAGASSSCQRRPRRAGRQGPRLWPAGACGQAHWTDQEIPGSLQCHLRAQAAMTAQQETRRESQVARDAGRYPLSPLVSIERRGRRIRPKRGYSKRSVLRYRMPSSFRHSDMNCQRPRSDLSPRLSGPSSWADTPGHVCASARLRGLGRSRYSVTSFLPHRARVTPTGFCAFLQDGRPIFQALAGLG